MLENICAFICILAITLAFGSAAVLAILLVAVVAWEWFKGRKKDGK